MQHRNLQPPGPPRMGWSIPAQGPFSQKEQSFIPATLLGAELAVTGKTQFPEAVPFILKHPLMVMLWLEPTWSRWDGV